MVILLTKIISGGQSGVDQAALQVAWELGYQTGGTAPQGYRTDEGPCLRLRDLYGLKESWSPGYRVRTIQNVQDADQTVWFGVTDSPGAVLTIGTARRLGKPILINPSVESLQKILQTSYPVRILNVAGNRKRTHPEAAELAAATLALALPDHSLAPLR